MPDERSHAALATAVEPAPRAAPPKAVRAAEAEEEAPPFLGTWRNVYLFVAGELALVIAALWAMTRWAS